jgi:drug/metabolite transporter (DMT)-like permease
VAALLALVSAVLFGLMTIALRYALRRSPDAEVGTLVTSGTAFVLVSLSAVAHPPSSFDAGELGVFALAGLLAPGGSQILFTYAVRDAGPSRTSVVVGAAPLVAVAIALVALDEPLRPALLAGAVLVVAGGIALVAERRRPEHVRVIGLVFALLAAILFATRDNVVRWASGDTPVTSTAAAAAAMASGLVVLGVYVAAVRGRRALLPSGRTFVAFVPVGVFFGLSYVALFEAYYRGRVGVVSPIVATETLWTVLLAALLLRRTELIGRRLLFGALLVVAGGALIGAFR